MFFSIYIAETETRRRWFEEKSSEQRFYLTEGVNENLVFEVCELVTDCHFVCVMFYRSVVSGSQCKNVSLHNISNFSDCRTWRAYILKLAIASFFMFARSEVKTLRTPSWKLLRRSTRTSKMAAWTWTLPSRGSSTSPQPLRAAG